MSDAAGPRSDGERLQKVLAAAGVASRRVCEQLIAAGRVSVNGRVVTELGTRVDPAVDKVAVDGSAVQLDVSKRYVMLNKPTGVVSSMSDERGRPGKERYVPDPDPAKTMLGAAQWSWLADQLFRPAEIRLIVSSTQVLAEGHGWERWGNLPLERRKLFDTIRQSGAKGVILLSGDRHIGALYRETPLDLILLSACETATGDQRAALGLAGIAVKAGARSAVGTLWAVNDEATAVLVKAFYRGLREPGVSRAVALQRAQRELLADRRYRHPRYWSPFLLISNWL